MKLIPLAAAALLVLGSVSAKAEPAPDTVKYGYIAATAYYWDIYAAIQKGFMKEQNLKVEATRIDSASQSIQTLLTGAIDVLSSNTELAMLAVEKGGDLAIISNEMRRTPWALMAAPEIKTIHDLKGKVVGVTQLANASTIMAQMLLKRGGLEHGDYKMIQLGGTPNRLAALTRGAVQATLLAQPADIKAEESGMRRLGNVDQAFDGTGIVFAARRSWVEQHNDVAVRFLKGAIAGMRWLHDPANRDEAVEVLVKAIGVKKDLAGKTYDYFMKNRIVSKDGTLPLQHLKNYLVLMHGPSTTADPKRYVDFSALERAQKSMRAAK
jgi:NitT/TauT family transport system substrate-binding protein